MPALTSEDLELLLRAWGRVYGVARLEEIAERRSRGALGGYGDHPIARSLSMAPGRKQRVYRPTPRDGSSRRRFMAAKHGLDAAGHPLLAIVPMAFVDPVPCNESRGGGGGGSSSALSIDASPELRRVQTEAMALLQIDPLRGKVLRVNYCEDGSHREKAARLADQMGVPLSRDRYRDELDHARTWMHARLL